MDQSKEQGDIRVLFVGDGKFNSNLNILREYEL